MTDFVHAHHAAVKAKNAADLARAEREAQASGKEPFTLAGLEAALNRGSQARRAEALRLMYYVSHPEIQTLEEFAALLHLMELYE